MLRFLPLPLNAGVLASDVHVISLQVGLAISNITVMPAVANELASNITLSELPGIEDALAAPPEVVDQWVKSLQLPVPPTQ